MIIDFIIKYTFINIPILTILTNAMAYGTRRLNATITRVIQ